MKPYRTTAAIVTLSVAAFTTAAAEAPPLFDGLGIHSRKVVTASPAAQKYFDQGLAFLFAFNHDEAIRSFWHAAALDPDCAMAHWGVAIASGPHYNKPDLPADRGRQAWDSLQKALREGSDVPARGSGPDRGAGCLIRRPDGRG